MERFIGVLKSIVRFVNTKGRATHPVGSLFGFAVIIALVGTFLLMRVFTDLRNELEDLKGEVTETSSADSDSTNDQVSTLANTSSDGTAPAKIATSKTKKQSAANPSPTNPTNPVNPTDPVKPTDPEDPADDDYLLDVHANIADIIILTTTVRKSN